MINKFQVGGAAPQDQQAQIQQAIAQISQATGEQPETIVAALKNGKNNFKKVLQALQQGDVQTAKQLIQQLAGKPMARLGAKLNYIRSLKGDCPEGQEVKYFKQGGQMKCKCVDKAAGGEKVKDGKKEIADFKKACKGRKFEDGGKSKPKYTKDQIAGRTPVKTVNGVKYFLNGDGQVVKDPKGKESIHPNDTVHIQNPTTKKTEVRDLTNDHRHKQYKRLTAAEYQRQSNSKKNDIDLKGYCKGGKAKKHKFGGSLNGIPFINMGIV